MNIGLFILGLLLTLVTVYDMIYTILSPRGAGFIVDRVSSGFWKFFVFLNNRDGRKKMLRYIGPFLLVVIVLTWIILLWLGNTLMVYSDSEALWSASKQEFISGFSENLYFVAYVLSSMGSGDFTPATDAWMIYTGFISFTGVVFLSLAISFLIPIIDAITLKRQVSLHIHILGRNPNEILARYEHNNYEDLLKILENLEPSLLKLAQNHLAYPVIHYFHSTHTFESLPVKLVSLDEAMSVLLYKVDKKNIADIRMLDRAYRAMTYYLSTLANAFIEPENNEPVSPNTTKLQNISENSSSRGTKDNRDLSERRKLLLAYLQSDGWDWNDMENDKSTIELNLD